MTRTALGIAIAHAALRHARSLGWEQPAQHSLARVIARRWAREAA